MERNNQVEIYAKPILRATNVKTITLIDRHLRTYLVQNFHGVIKAIFSAILLYKEHFQFSMTKGNSASTQEILRLSQMPPIIRAVNKYVLQVNINRYSFI